MTAAKPQRAQAAPLPPPSRNLARWLWLPVLLALAFGGSSLHQNLQDPDAFPIRKITVDGDFRYLAPAPMQALVSGSVKGGFFQVDVGEIRTRILQEPWVRDVSVARVWPDAIHVSVIEQQPVARWGANALLSDKAQVFSPALATFPSGLVQVHGPVGSEADVWSTYLQASARLAKLGLKIKSLALSDRRASRIDLEDGTVLLLGRHFIDERLDRLVRAWPRILRENWSKVASIDLRYTNGFAVKERTPSALPPKLAKPAKAP